MSVLSDTSVRTYPQGNSAVTGIYEKAAKLDRVGMGLLRLGLVVVLVWNERNEVDILRRRMDASVLLIKALGGGWNVSNLPQLSALQR